MNKYIFVANEKALIESEEFKNDDITIAINEVNETIGFAKCKGIKFEIDDKWKDTESIIEVNGYSLRGFTVAKLITKGIVKIKL